MTLTAILAEKLARILEIVCRVELHVIEAAFSTALPAQGAM